MTQQQLPLFELSSKNADPPIPDPPAGAIEPARKNNPQRLDLRREAAYWIRTNPRAFAAFERVALEKAREGKPFGMKAIAEHVRAEMALAVGDDGYKINNNYVAYIARELAARHPGLGELLRFRQTVW